MAIFSVVDRICGTLSNHRSVNHLRFLDQPQLHQLAGAQRHQVRVGRIPHRIRVEAEVLQSQHGVARVRHHPGTPVFEVLDAADADVGFVDVNPVVGKKLRLVDDERDGDEVAIPETAGRLGDLGRRRRIERADKLAYRHGRDEVAAGVSMLAVGGGGGDRGHAPLPALNRDHRLTHFERGAAALNGLGQLLPHLTGTMQRIAKAIDQGLDDRAVALDPVPGRGESARASRGP